MVFVVASSRQKVVSISCVELALLEWRAKSYHLPAFSNPSIEGLDLADSSRDFCTVSGSIDVAKDKRSLVLFETELILLKG